MLKKRMRAGAIATLATAGVLGMAVPASAAGYDHKGGDDHKGGSDVTVVKSEQRQFCQSDSLLALNLGLLGSADSGTRCVQVGPSIGD